MTTAFRRSCALLTLFVATLAAACSSGTGATSGGSCAAIAGAYDDDETFSGTCPSTTPITRPVTVTVTNGTDVVITNGMSFRVGCTLQGCSCTTKSGNEITFDSTGFSETQTNSGCTTTSRGTKR